MKRDFFAATNDAEDRAEAQRIICKELTELLQNTPVDEAAEWLKKATAVAEGTPHYHFELDIPFE